MMLPDPALISFHLLDTYCLTTVCHISMDESFYAASGFALLNCAPLKKEQHDPQFIIPCLPALAVL